MQRDKNSSLGEYKSRDSKILSNLQSIKRDIRRVFVDPKLDPTTKKNKFQGLSLYIARAPIAGSHVQLQVLPLYQLSHQCCICHATVS